MNDNRLTISVPEAGRRIGIARCKAYELTRRPGFPVLKIGKRLLVPVAALERWVEEQAHEGRPFESCKSISTQIEA
jgi:hypothetical protein